MSRTDLIPTQDMGMPGATIGDWNVAGAAAAIVDLLQRKELVVFKFMAAHHITFKCGFVLKFPKDCRVSVGGSECSL